MAGGFVAGFLLLRATWKAERSSGCKKHRITGLFTLRHSSGSASAMARSFASLIPTPLLRHSLPALEMLRISLSGPSNR
ncbi:MAG: hypothetical protein LBH58_05380, partial [Tannerellaceae bacterium]|nr:hypothetical protein [Tannerellaceae bacterium]